MPVLFSKLLMQRSRCSYEEQLSVFTLIETFVALTSVCQKYGTLSLEDMVWTPNTYSLDKTLSPDQYQKLQFILTLVLDGRAPRVIEDIGLIYISKRKKGLSLLQDMIILEGALCCTLRHSLYDTRIFLHRLLDAPLNHPDTAARHWMEMQKKKTTAE